MPDFKATKTMWDFMQNQSYVRLIAGAIGSGKSVLCCHELVRLALNQEPNEVGERKTRSLIVRNTADQLRSTTMKTFFDWFQPGLWGHYKVTERTFFMEHNLADGTRLKAEFMFIPLDHPDDVRKALSLEATFLWCNEWRELAPQVVDGLLMRLRRYPSEKDGGFTRSGAIFDTNMPDMDTWHHKMMEEPPANWSVFIQPPGILSREEYVQTYNEEPEEDSVIIGYDNTEWVVNPDADNVDHLDPLYYPEIIPGKTEDFVRVYLRCLYGRSMAGLPVYDKTFNATFHISANLLEAIRSPEYPIIIGQDFGRCPACALVQRNVRGQIVVLAEETSTNMGIETFVTTKLKPILAQFAGCNFIIAPDPAGWAKQQIGEISPVDVLKNEGFKVIRPVTNDPERRIQCVERLLSQNIDGKPVFLINPSCESLIKGFRYGYKYRTNKLGQQDDKPLKDEYSHCVVEGTLVSTPTGRVQIETLSVGDLVTTPVGPRRVLATMNREVHAVIEVIALSEAPEKQFFFTSLLCTADHPICTLTGKVRADDLTCSDVVMVEYGDGVLASQVFGLVWKSDLEDTYRVYDLTVEDDHRFFADGILVGNCHDALQYACLVAEANTDKGELSTYGQKREIKVSNYVWV